jgi:hypothetical protein
LSCNTGFYPAEVFPTTLNNFTFCNSCPTNCLKCYGSSQC